MKLVILIAALAFTACAQKKKMAKTETMTEGSNKVTIEQPNPASKEVLPNDGIITTVKIVRVSCASLVAIITEDEKRDKGEEWVPANARMRQPFKGAFTIHNQEDFAAIKENYVFKAKLLDTKYVPKTDAVRCQLADFPPATVYYVKALSKPVEEQ